MRLLPILLICIHVAFVSSLEPPSSLDERIKALLVDYATVLDRSLPEDESLYQTVIMSLTEATMNYPHHVDDAHLLHFALRQIYNSLSYITKDQLVRNNTQVVTREYIWDVVKPSWISEPFQMLFSLPIRDLNAIDGDGYTALCLATSLMLHNEMRLLSERLPRETASIRCRGTTVFHFAVYNIDVPAFSILMDRFPMEMSNVDEYGRSPAAVAHELGYSEFFDIVGPNLVPVDAPVVKVGSTTRVLETNVNSFGGWIQRTQRQELRVSQSTRPCNLPVVSVEELTSEIFHRQFFSMRRPFVLTGATTDWNATKLFEKQTFVEQYGEIDVLSGKIPYAYVFGEQSGKATVAEMVDYFEAVVHDEFVEESPYYAFDEQFLSHLPSTSYEFPAPFQFIIKPKNTTHQFALGPAMSGAPFHFHCDATNALLYGRRRWLLVPPAFAFYSKETPYDYLSMEHLYEDLTPSAVPMECWQESGDIIYVPKLWGHMTLNDGETISIAVEYDGGDC